MNTLQKIKLALAALILALLAGVSHELNVAIRDIAGPELEMLVTDGITNATDPYIDVYGPEIGRDE